MEESDSSNNSSGKLGWPHFVVVAILTFVMIVSSFIYTHIELIHIFIVQIFFFSTPVVLWSVEKLSCPLPKWILFNISAILMAIVSAAFIGLVLGTGIIIGLMSLFIIYDFIAVHRSNVMESIGKNVFKINLPLVVIVPISRSFSLNAIRTDMSETGMGGKASTDAARCSMIGIGDLILPAALAVSAVEVTESWITLQTLSIPVGTVGAIVGAVVGLSLLRKLSKSGMVAALLGLVPGTVIGYLVGALIAGASLSATFSFRFYPI